ncbi:hypothetical protein, partial [Bartonella phoceensis]
MDKSRQQFERKFYNKFNFELTNKGNYRYFSTNIAWEASRKSLINNLPESINCPTAPELIWLQVDPEPEEINKPEFPVNLRSDDVT